MRYGLLLFQGQGNITVRQKDESDHDEHNGTISVLFNDSEILYLCQ